MSEKKKPPTILEACLGKPEQLNTLVGYAADSIVSKTILDKRTGTITLFAFDKGQTLSEHTSPYDAVVQVIDGQAQLTIAGDEITAGAGDLIVMPANVPHNVTAVEPLKMLLIMIRDWQPR
jgi:quercetin dioxygenase-like cupin family protein